MEDFIGKITIKNKTIRTPNVEKATEMFELAKKVLWLANVNEKLTENL